ncbi:MAG: stage V sporulation T C-terminal domain-containing protein [Clostridiales bacterium]
MKKYQLIRKIDFLGRIVIPKQIRRSFRIVIGDPLEFFVNQKGELILEKYSLVKGLGSLLADIANPLHEATGSIVIITDRDNTVFVAGASREEYGQHPIGAGVDRVLASRTGVLENKPGTALAAAILEDDERKAQYSAVIIEPILLPEMAVGALCLASREKGRSFGDLEVTLARFAATLLAKNISAYDE